MTSPTPVKLQFAAPRRGKPAKHFADFSAAELTEALAAFNLPSYRGKQIGTHYFGHLTRNADEMTDLPAGVREELVDELLPELATEIRSFRGDDDNRDKTLWRLFDGDKAESVSMSHADRTTPSATSQRGLGMAS